MHRFALLMVLVAVLGLSPLAASAKPVVGISWSNFQEERWKTDEASVRGALEAAGVRVISADAQSSTEKQMADVENLLARGAELLIVVAHDADAILPAVLLAQAAGVHVIAYDRLIEWPGVFYLSFDNREVGRIQARALQALVPRGRYVFIKGSAQDPNSRFVHEGQLDVLGPALRSGEIENVGEQFIDGWLPEGAQRTMEQILTATAGRVDAVVCSNDGMAGGVAAALAGAGRSGVPVSGQDGDHAALARVAAGTQAVSVWKDSRALGTRAAAVALALLRGTAPADVSGRIVWNQGPQRRDVDAILLEPTPITRDNLAVVIDAGWVSHDVVCARATDPLPAACDRSTEP